MYIKFENCFYQFHGHDIILMNNNEKGEKMDISKLSIKALKAKLENEFSEELLQEIQQDARKGVQSIFKAYKRKLLEHERIHELYKYEREAWARGHNLVAGVDEVGRGPLAGPVVIASVILPHDCFIEKLNDSKKLSEATREKLYDIILAKAIAVSRAVIDEKTIDRINIYQATMNGMYEAIYGLNPKPDEVLIDAVKLNKLEIPTTSIIKGDAKSASIAAASIVAKVERDRMMKEMDKIYPEYEFAKNKGYGTAEHLTALKKYGPCKIHRHSFEPIKSMVNNHE